MACFEHLGGDNVQIGTSVPQRDQTVFIYGPFRMPAVHTIGSSRPTAPWFA